jgi:hypothetical protein
MGNEIFLTGVKVWYGVSMKVCSKCKAKLPEFVTLTKEGEKKDYIVTFANEAKLIITDQYNPDEAKLNAMVSIARDTDLCFEHMSPVIKVEEKS